MWERDYVTEVIRNILRMHKRIVPGMERGCEEVRACIVLLGGLGHFTDSWSPTKSLRVGNGLATLLDNMRESIHTLHCNLWCLQGTQSKRISRSIICIWACSLGFHVVTLERRPHKTPHIFPPIPDAEYVVLQLKWNVYVAHRHTQLL